MWTSICFKSSGRDLALSTSVSQRNCGGGKTPLSNKQVHHICGFTTLWVIEQICLVTHYSWWSFCADTHEYQRDTTEIPKRGHTPMSPKWCFRKPGEQGDHSHLRIATDRNGYPVYPPTSSCACHAHLCQQITTPPRKDLRNQSWKDLWVRSSIPLSILGQLYPLSPV